MLQNNIYTIVDVHFFLQRTHALIISARHQPSPECSFVDLNSALNRNIRKTTKGLIEAFTVHGSTDDEEKFFHFFPTTKPVIVSSGHTRANILERFNCNMNGSNVKQLQSDMCGAI